MERESSDSHACIDRTGACIEVLLGLISHSSMALKEEAVQIEESIISLYGAQEVVDEEGYGTKDILDRIQSEIKKLEEYRREFSNRAPNAQPRSSREQEKAREEEERINAIRVQVVKDMNRVFTEIIQYIERATKMKAGSLFDADRAERIRSLLSDRTLQHLESIQKFRYVEKIESFGPMEDVAIWTHRRVTAPYTLFMQFACVCVPGVLMLFGTQLGMLHIKEICRRCALPKGIGIVLAIPAALLNWLFILGGTIVTNHEYAIAFPRMRVCLLLEWELCIFLLSMIGIYKILGVFIGQSPATYKSLYIVMLTHACLSIALLVCGFICGHSFFINACTGIGRLLMWAFMYAGSLHFFLFTHTCMLASSLCNGKVSLSFISKVLRSLKDIKTWLY
ncbi:uncharacterized protein NEMAJ01_0396 [Nematocida major]|uniref:uncharacterized protein n=1 Tax=Nematocida major TaxID=1912982 RepID=UPI0020084500|nr:uncharacterized protein NEMAJ01_0396 [Nematocida major]KAH9385500.1 hypothetical protein NEMAJ01_0396 [Nematocida major]